MKIAHVTDCYLPRVGGIETQVHGLAVRQRRAGHDPQVVTSVGAPAESDAGDSRVWRPRRDSASPRIRYERSWAGCNAVLAGGFDLVHVHASTWSPLAVLTAAATSRRGIPTVLTAHSMLAWAEPAFAATAPLLGWPDWPVEWTAVSTAAAAPLQRLVGARRRVAVLPNAVDPQDWQIRSRARDPNRLVIATVGRLAARKRPRQLLRILRSARAQLPAHVRLEAVIVGDGPLRPVLERYLDRHRMSDWVSLAGARDHAGIRAVYEDADVYVAPAHLESFGIAALEARSAGLPVIAHARSGVSDFVRHGLEGLLVHDDRQLARRIVELATTPAVLQRLREHNAVTPPGLDWDTVLELHEAVYARARAARERVAVRAP